jgi:hypothetical protein
VAASTWRSARPVSCAPAVKANNSATGPTIPQRMTSVPSSASLSARPAIAVPTAVSGATRRRSSGTVTSRNSGIAKPRGNNEPTW